MYNPLSKLLTWYLSPVQGTAEGAARTSLGVLPSRLEPTDIVAHLIESGYTPASEADVRNAFASIHDRRPSAFEELVACDFVASFGLLAV